MTNERKELFPYTWSVDDKNLDKTIIRAYGLDENDKNVCLKIENFRPHVYIELPNSVEWTITRCGLVCSKLESILNNTVKLEGHFVQRKKLYYNNGNQLFPFLLIYVDHINIARSLEYKLKYNREVYITSIGKVHLKLHEIEANPILQLLTEKDLKFSTWFSFEEQKNSASQFTSCDFEYTTSFDTLKISNSKKVANPLIMSWDIETYSSNHMSNKPDPSHPSNKVFQISCVMWRHNTDIVEKHILCLGNLNQKRVGEDVNIMSFSNEGNMLKGFSDFIRKTNPNVMIGFNIFGFDIPYMYKRASINNILPDFDKQGFPLAKHGNIIPVKWSSSAFKNQVFEFLDVEGRMWVDMLPLIRRDYPNFSVYSLKAVATNLLKDTHKDPLTKFDIFNSYDIAFNTKNASDAKKENALSVVAKYCVQDSFVVLQLFRKLSSWIGLCEMSAICNVQAFALFTQGQQIRVFSQVYVTCKNTYVIDKTNYMSIPGEEHYQGAHVIDPNPGVYDRVLPFDFNSLYPTTQIAYNIDYSTLVLDEKIPDSLCHVIEWQEDNGCEHDPKVIRKNEINNILENVAFRVKTLKEEIKKDKTGTKKDQNTSEIFQLLKSTEEIKDEKLKIMKAKPKFIICGKRKFRFLKNPLGVLPSILVNLLAARKQIRAEIKILEKQPSSPENDLQLLVLDRRQLACKISANSVYGSMGTTKGYLPFLPGAMCTTAMGRQNIKIASKSIETDWKGHLIYGDSVTHDTPILLRCNGNVEIKTIESIGSVWSSYLQFKLGEEGLTSKQQDDNIQYEVWTDKGWASIKRVIRHRTNKKIYEVSTPTGCVRVTEDHSLLSPEGVQIKPTECKIGTELLHAFPEFEENKKKDIFSYEQVYIYGFFFGEAVIPDNILYGSYNDKEGFFEGYSDAHKDGIQIYGQLGAMNMYYLIRSLGYNVSITVKNSIYKLKYSNAPFRRNEIAIKKITLLGETKNYVYDLETDVGHFHAGVGQIIVKNTDSAYVSFPHINSPKECWDYALQVADHVSRLFPSPMRLEYEEKIYWKFMILTKKRYMCLVCKKDGIVLDEMVKKGVLLTRRDNCKFVRDIYEKNIHRIFNGDNLSDILYDILCDLNKLFSKSIDFSNFVVSKSIGDVGNMMVKEERNTKGKLVGRIGDYTVKLLPDDEKDRDKQFKLKKADTDKDYYFNSLPAIVQLGERMKLRGDNVDAGSRLEYVITTNGGYDGKMYEKVESYDYFKNHKDVLELDYLYYLKSLATPLDQVLLFIYKQRNFLSSQYKLRCKKKDLLDELKDLFRPNIIFEN